MKIFASHQHLNGRLTQAEHYSQGWGGGRGGGLMASNFITRDCRDSLTPFMTFLAPDKHESYTAERTAEIYNLHKQLLIAEAAKKKNHNIGVMCSVH
jgi:hypothetical protein